MRAATVASEIPPEHQQSFGGPASVTASMSRNVCLCLLAAAFLLPVIWMIAASFDAHASWSLKFPSLTLKNYAAIMNATDLRTLYNSLYLATVSTVIVILCAFLSAYVLSRYRVRFKHSIMLAVLFTSALPVTMLILPLYQMYVELNWTDSLLTISLFLAGSSLPFAIWLLKNFIDQVPRELEEAAALSGVSTSRILLRVVIPLAFPGIAVTAIITFAASWGAFLVPLVLDTNQRDMPGAIAIYQFLGGSNGGVQFGSLAAYSLLFSLPVVALYVAVARHISGAFNLGGGVKG